ncbi:amylo-alpha-1,6-glucosidase [Aphanothece sacrum]|uniref:Glycogen-debranching protein n=1 Tax=Aphanothece sacrum FPU1 TaxID=1920663 RepID=A0A401IMU6_APHSA|nr:amylo-alpha-1,6-glucosidase [Aphanothece sacrum]GBF82571.1 glycogen-debranching protein [Aphanothece sacrum FPU1]GBF84705.1 glycogen-debranching protein [Aphanothece sacrum FPU3]
MIDFGREICNCLEIAQEREWLITNGIGGYGLGTVSGVLTRSYHGLLIASLNPPLDRTLLLTKVDDTVHYNGEVYSLFTNRWINDLVEPAGYQLIENFKLEGTIPIWNFSLGNGRLEKRIWMQHKANTTYIYYTFKQGSQPLTLSLKALVNYRSHHRGNLPNLTTNQIDRGVKISLSNQSSDSFYLLTDQGKFSPIYEIYGGFELVKESYRGLPDRDSHLCVGTFEATLNPGDSLTFVATTGHPNPLVSHQLNLHDHSTLGKLLDGISALQERRQYEQSLLDQWHSSGSPRTQSVPSWINHLVLAADQFIVDRPLDNHQIGKSVIAGYPWFNDWGRDTMISLPGLTLATGRPEIASLILRTFANYISQGMLPNCLPDGNHPLTDHDYNTVDATLWYFEAIRLYYEHTGDKILIRDLFPKLEEIIDWHCRGTRYNIKLDPQDGLIFAGAQGVQLTWMDAKAGDYVVTPRIGKPVEINALWYNALRIVSELAQVLDKSYDLYDNLSQSTLKGFNRFWNEERGYCFDVIDSPELGNDPSLRPNQLLAVSLGETPLSIAQQKRIVEVCGELLLTSHGLRSLSPKDRQYRGDYGGDQYKRDTGYHQGTVWGWLMGPYVLAYQRVFNDPIPAREFLEPMAYHLRTAGLGTISEIFDGNIPYYPRGAVAQAWSVAEVLRVWLELNQ